MADNNNPIKYSDLVKPDDSITKLIAQLDQLSDAYMNTLSNIKSEAITVKAALESVSGREQPDLTDAKQYGVRRPMLINWHGRTGIWRLRKVRTQSVWRN